jgi:Skp family chaperone for outer membrane proteins
MISRRSLVCTFALSIAALALPGGRAAAQDSPRIAIVNPAKVFNEMQETKDLKQAMESNGQAIKAEGQKRQADVEEAKKKRSLFNEGTEDFNKASKELIEKAIALQTWQELIKQDLARQQKNQMSNLFKKIEEATKEVATAKKLDIVIVEQKIDLPSDPGTMDQINVDQLRSLINQRTVMYNNGKYDITSEVLAAVDAKYRKK